VKDTLKKTPTWPDTSRVGLCAFMFMTVDRIQPGWERLQTLCNLHS